MTHRVWRPTRSAGSPWRWALALALLTGLFGSWLPLAGVTRAAADLTITVTSAADPTGATGTCTLRDAVAAANAQATVGSCAAVPGTAGSGTTIDFALGSGAQMITLGSTLPGLTQPLTLRGPGAALLTIRRDAAATPAPFSLIYSSQDLAVVGLNLTGGYSDGGYGGAFFVSGFATVTDSTFSNNNSSNYAGVFFSGNGAAVTNSTFTNNSSSNYGGAFFTYGDITVTGSTFTNNSASKDGGGFYAGEGNVTVTGSTFTNNSAGDYGGGFYAFGNATVTDSVLRNNRAELFGGGGFYAHSNTTVTGSTFVDNSTGEDGGGFYSRKTATVSNSTFTTNSAINGGGGFFAVDAATVTGSTFDENTADYGGGFNTGATGTTTGIAEVAASSFTRNTTVVGGGGFNTRGTATVVGSTFATNVGPNAAAQGGGAFNADVSATVTNSIFTNGPTGVNCTAAGGKPTDGGGVVASDATCVNGGLRSQVADPKILALSDNGGPTQTHALLDNSPARGIGIAADCAARSTDQRGVPRPATGCDSGAFQTPVLAITPATLPGGTFGTAYSQALTASGGIAPYTFATTPGTLPGGLTLTTGGLLSGTPTVAGSFTFTVTTADKLGYTGAQDFTLAIAKGAQTIDFAIPTGNPTYTAGDTFTVGATASSGLTVSFAASGPCTVIGTTVTTISAGDCVITASQAGDTTYAAAPEVPRTFPVGKAAQTIDFNTPAGSPSYTLGDTFTVGATASSGLPVTFAASGACTIAGTTVTTTSAGVCTVTASQSGDATYLAAPDAIRTFPVGKIAQTIAFATPTGTPAYTVGQQFTVGATASSGLAVAFAATGPCSLAGATVTATGVGTCTVVASQAGDETYAVAPEVTRTFPIGKRTQTIAFDAPAGAPTYTTGQTFAVGATATSGLPVTFAASGACTIAGTTVATTGVGVCTVTASQAGDATYLAAPEVNRSFAVSIRQVLVTASTSGQGAVTPAGATSFAVGSQATYRAVPATGQVFVGWTLDDQPSGFASPLTFTVDTNRTLVANFAPRPTFADVAPGDSAWDGITQLAARGIIKGYGDGRFGEDDTVLRAQVAALIVRAFGWDTARPNGPMPFSDLGGVDPELQRAIAILAARGIINGYGDGTFGPTDEVTHAQVISFIARSMVQAGYWTAVTQDDPALYPNVPLASGHRLDLLTYARYAGAIPDRPANANWPDWQTPASRGWTAQVLWQALSSYLGTDRVP